MNFKGDFYNLNCRKRGIKMPQNFYELVWIFIIYAFIGWCVEVAYAALDTGKFVNRGFLNGPYCPIYGCGVVIVVAALTPLEDNLIILFLGSMLLTTLLEYLTGFILEKVFHNKWWDYSNIPFNIQGYVCLKFSILWGLACTFVMKVFHPIIYKFITTIPFVLGVVLLVILMIGFFIDLGATVSTILKLNKRLILLDEMAQKLHILSDEIGENIYEGVTTVKEKSEEIQDSTEELRDKLEEKTEDIKENLKELPETVKAKYEEKKQETRETIAESILETKTELEYRKEAARKEYEELTEKYKNLLNEKNAGFKRLMKAFPDMISRDQNETLKKYKEYFDIRFRGEKKEDEQ